MNVLGAMARGESETVAPLFALPLSETSCLSCGACVSVCPVAAITEKPHYEQVSIPPTQPKQEGARHGRAQSPYHMHALPVIPLNWRLIAPSLGS